MEPNNIENQIREKLNSREIQPSAQAWDRLDAMLTVAEEKKTKRSFFSFKYIGIAASVLVFVTLGLFYFNQKSIIIEPQNTVVEAESNETLNTKNQNSTVEDKQNTEVVVSNENIKATNVVTKNNSKVSINNQSKTQHNQIIKNKEIVFQNSSDVAQKELPKSIESKEIINQKLINSQSDENLLANLDQIVNEETTPKKNHLKIDAKNLLSQVDTELETSFREKVLKSIDKKYKNAKEALANRNLE